ncbi:MAG: hypothetical protein GY755_05275 [Chloroflexi bacterium]|nr:hypothetical protein [Chloroflexota bacterium]
MKRKKFSRATLLFGLMLVFLLSSCSFVRIQNVAVSTATVSVRVPDSGKTYVRTIRSGAIVDVFSSHGGSYTITMIESEEYINFLKDLRSEIERKLFSEGKTLTAEEVVRLTENLKQIDSSLEQTRLPGATCSGYVPDFDTVVVVISFDDFNANWSLSCSSGSSN